MRDILRLARAPFLLRVCALLTTTIFLAAPARAHVTPPPRALAGPASAPHEIAPRDTPAIGGQSLAHRIARIINRPQLKHALFGIEFYDLDLARPVYELNADKFFGPASTTKLLTMGSALALFGPNHRFTTSVYRNGSVTRDGILNGDLVLVASGDPNISSRVQPDDTLAFENEDHAYDGSPDTKAVPGDPLVVLRELAGQVKAKGINRISGHVMVDDSLFAGGMQELGTGTVISSITLNDNIVDVTVRPGMAQGTPAIVTASPQTPYVRFVNQVVTGATASKPEVNMAPDLKQDDGNHIVTLTGSMPLGNAGILYAYAAPEPKRFAEVALAQTLREAGVAAEPSAADAAPDMALLAHSYTLENLVAQHRSPPYAQEVKITLKVSQNLHASTTPFILGATLGHARERVDQTGFDLEHRFLQSAGLALSEASQADGAGGSAHFTPSFMVSYLAFMAKQKFFQTFYDALPVLGRDGTLFNIQTNSPAAGKVHAKTGTWSEEDHLNHKAFVSAKALAGYTTNAAGHHIAFCIFLNNLSVGNRQDITDVAGQTVGEIAAAGYLSAH
ncbi:MAG: D-alanyl-D-alanine carboxypeptidase/D-alanyl-D-alanine-endopeptidase [Candidatus Eremiobacteraeota bacterium]|nr:D-alanyl-D-alanine carboxypeptidase/D-alanyl-D-alanine-endopeptidase [Candidatus Eremiobacteraeota bacterium]